LQLLGCEWNFHPYIFVDQLQQKYEQPLDVYIMIKSCWGKEIPI
jgi:hypothetical protein